uniref:NB-ARC domain-containing protein n=1 Tax=Arundo donax TaxID=35708 RepID=A0A0A9BIT3_ARUDO
MVIHLQPLDEVSSEVLFLRKAGLANCSLQFRDKMNSILRRCDGIPLVIVSVATHMCQHGATREDC